jgi:UDP-N-acetylmuramoyl-tripeptide--D-alanyl-D-alanine ligase
MAELGPSSAAEHQAVADLAASLGIRLVPVGTDLYGPGGLTVEQALDALGPISDGDAVLVKASRVAGLEVLADRLSRG